MSRGFFDYPQKSSFGGVLPKTKVFAFGKATRRLRDAFAAQIDRIVWLFKLAPETTNLPAGPGVNEIQIFGVELKPGIAELSEDILSCIDSAIAFPIFFEITTSPLAGPRVKSVAAYKRPSDADPARWVVGDYFSSDWVPVDTPRSPLPVALNLTALYEQMLCTLMPVPLRPGESLRELAERSRIRASKERELQRLEAQLKREKQFNRRVELNAHLRRVKADIDSLTSGKAL